MSSKEKILKYISDHGKARAEDIRIEFNLGRAIIHRHLLTLLREKKVIKFGKSPLVYYVINHSKTEHQQVDISRKDTDFLKNNYLYISPRGEFLYGIDGFKSWVARTKQEKVIKKLIAEYIKYRKNTQKLKNNNGLLDGTDKFNSTFSEIYLDRVFFSDFYALPKFGKTLLGQTLLYGKQAQSERLIREISNMISDDIKNTIKKYKIEAVAFIPPTVPRKIQFLKSLENMLNLDLPSIKLTKAYSGNVPIAQKTLTRLEERIDNAKQTIFIKDQKIKYKKILIIDDAVGSGATLNEVAYKIKQLKPDSELTGYSIVGSFKGFDVISEV